MTYQRLYFAALCLWLTVVEERRFRATRTTELEREEASVRGPRSQMGLGSSVLFRGVHDVKDVQNEEEAVATSGARVRYLSVLEVAVSLR